MSAGIRLGAMLGALSVIAVGCGGGPEPIGVDASSESDAEIGERIVAEVEATSVTLDISAMTPAQAAEFGPLLDNLSELASVTEAVEVAEGAATARTDLEASGEASTTAMLLCGALIRGAGPAADGLPRVVGENGAEVRRCDRSDRDFP